MTSALHLLLLSFTLLLVRPTTGHGIPAPLQQAYEKYLSICNNYAGTSLDALTELNQDITSMNYKMKKGLENALAEVNKEMETLDEVKGNLAEKLMARLSQVYQELNQDIRTFEQASSKNQIDPSASFPEQKVDQVALKILIEERTSSKNPNHHKEQIDLLKETLAKLNREMASLRQVHQEALEKLGIDLKKIDLREGEEELNREMEGLENALAKKVHQDAFEELGIDLTKVPGADQLLYKMKNMIEALKELDIDLKQIELDENLDILARDDLISTVEHLVGRMTKSRQEAITKMKILAGRMSKSRHGRADGRAVRYDMEAEFRIAAAIRAEVELLWKAYQQIKEGKLTEIVHGERVHVEALLRLMETTIRLMSSDMSTNLFTSFLAASNPSAHNLQRALLISEVSSEELERLRRKAEDYQVTLGLLSATNNIVAAFKKENIFDREDVAADIKYLAKAQKLHHCKLVVALGGGIVMPEGIPQNAELVGRVGQHGSDEGAHQARGRMNKRRRRGHKRGRKGKRQMKKGRQ